MKLSPAADTLTDVLKGQFTQKMTRYLKPVWLALFYGTQTMYSAMYKLLFPYYKSDQQARFALKNWFRIYFETVFTQQLLNDFTNNYKIWQVTLETTHDAPFYNK